jgi:hypothetical protein
MLKYLPTLTINFKTAGSRLLSFHFTIGNFRIVKTFFHTIKFKASRYYFIHLIPTLYTLPNDNNLYCAWCTFHKVILKND